MDTRDPATATATHAGMSDWFEDVARALNPLDAPPGLPGWNHEYVVELIGDGPRAEAAVLLAIRAGLEPSVVFTLRRDDLTRHAGQVSFPGGRVDHDDAGVVATALRESHEEVALDPALAEPLGYLDCLETVSGFSVTPVVARLQPHAVLAPQPGEVARLFEVPLAFLLDPGNVRLVDYHSPWGTRKVYEYADIAPRIWGATAMILVNLMRRMGKMP